MDELRAEALRALTFAFIDTYKKAMNDYTPSETASRYPAAKPIGKPKAPQAGRQTITGLFERWKEEQSRGGKSGSTARRWEPVILSFVAYIGHDDAEAAAPSDVRNWRDTVLATGKTIPRTFNRVHLAALRSIFNLGRNAGLITSNPADGLKFTASEAIQTRPKGLTSEEAVAILKAASGALEATGRTSDVMRRVQRWVPWLCAYTGARVGEITQLRGIDVMTIEGVPCIRITPEAGAVKTRQYRDVPLHPHLIDLGFIEFARQLGDGPLFYSPDMRSKTPWSISANKLAAWVRDTVKVTDPRVKPNHGWRHAFKTVGRHVGIDRFYLNGICGHSIGTTEGDKYGETPMSAVLREIEKFPRWEV